MIRKVAQAQGRDAAYRMMAIDMMSNHLLSDHIQEEIKNAVERQQAAHGQQCDQRAPGGPHNGQSSGGSLGNAQDLTSTTGKAREERPSQEKNSEERKTEDSELQAGGPEHAPAAGEASSRLPTVTALADTCQTPDETGKFVRTRGKFFLLFFMYMMVGIAINQLLEQDEKAAGEASSWFPTETAPAETLKEMVEAEAQNTDTIENEDDANKTVPSDTCQATEDTWEVGELQAGGSVEQAPAAGEASSRFPTVTAPASDACQTIVTVENSQSASLEMEGSEPGGSEHAPTAGEDSRRFPTATALADTVQTAAPSIEDQKPNLLVGTYVIVRKPKWLKGETGKILGYDNYSGRYRVRLTAPIEPSHAVQEIKAINLVAVTSGNPEKWEDIMLKDDEKWVAMEHDGSKWYDDGGPDGTKWYEIDEAAMVRLIEGSLHPADYDNPHFRRLASKLLKAGQYLSWPAMMNMVSSYIHAARENGAVWQSIRQEQEIKDMQDARRGEIM